MNNEQAPQRKVPKEFAVEPITVQRRRVKAIFVDGPAMDRTMDTEPHQQLRVPIVKALRAAWDPNQIGGSTMVAAYQLVGVDWGVSEAHYSFMKMED